METTEDLAAEWFKLQERKAKLEALIKPVETELLERLKVGDEIQVPRKLIKLEKRDRRQLKPSELLARVSEEVWLVITERVPVADRIKVAIRDGLLTQQTVDESSTRTRPWLAVKK